MSLVQIKTSLPIPPSFTWTAYENNIVYLEVDVPAHAYPDPLPVSGWLAGAVGKARSKRTVTPTLKPYLLYKLKAARVPRSLVERPPLQWSLAKNSSHAPKSLPSLPAEISNIIIREALENAPNPISRACSLALVCVPWAQLIHNSPLLWAWLMQYATSRSQRFLISQLACFTPLHIKGTSSPREFHDYIPAAASITVVAPYDNDWVAALSHVALQHLVKLDIRYCTYHHLTLHAENLEHLEIGTRVEVFIAPRLRQLRLFDEFQYCPRIPGETPQTWTRAIPDTRSFFSLCLTITELVVERWHRPTQDSSWQEVLGPLSGGPLRILIIDNYDGVTFEQLHGHQHLRFPSLKTLKTRSLLKLREMDLLQDADVLAAEFQELVQLVEGFKALRSLVFFISQETYAVSDLTVLIPGIETADTILPELRSIRCESSLGVHALGFLLLAGKRQFIDVSMDIPTIESHAQLGHHMSSCMHAPQDNSGVADRINLLERLLPWIQNNISQDTTLAIETFATVALKPVTKFSLGSWLQLSVEADIIPKWCECTFKNGYYVSPVHALTAFASSSITRICNKLQVTAVPYSGYHYSVPDMDGSRTGSYASWSPWDPFHAPDVDNFLALRQNLRMMSDVKELTITVYPSVMFSGNALLKALLANHEAEYLEPEHETTFPKLAMLRICASTQKSLAIGDPLHRIWEQMHSFLDLRAKLADTGRCVSLQRLVLEGNFCHCRNPGRTESAIAKFGPCAEWILPEQGCQNCS